MKMDKLNEQIDFYEMTEGDPELLVMLIELRRHRQDNWKQRAEAAEALARDMQLRYDTRTPTAWAYNQACQALEKHRERANGAEAQLAELARQEPVLYALRFKNIDGSPERLINDNCLFRHRENAERYGLGGNYVKQESGKIEWVPNPALNPEVIPLFTRSAPAAVPTKDQIREVFMRHGFTVKEGQSDLKPYVYDAAYALFGTSPVPAAAPVDLVPDTTPAQYESLRKGD